MRLAYLISAWLLATMLPVQAQQPESPGDGKARVELPGYSREIQVAGFASAFGEFPPITGERIACTGGDASGFRCRNVDLLSYLPITDIGGTKDLPGLADTRLNDIWGWTDPQTGKEYALVGRTDGTAFVDVSNPINPVFLGSLPLTEGARATSWRDIKVFGNFAFVVSDLTQGHGMQVFNLERLRAEYNRPATFTPDTTYMGIERAHNLAINEDSGFAYAVGSETCGGGLHMIDISDPLIPTFAGCYAEPLTGRGLSGYTHDTQCVIYNGPDLDYAGREICVSSNETAVVVTDVTNKQDPKTVSVAEYPDVGYAHQGWLTPDHTHFLLDDELDELGFSHIERTRTLIWNLEDLDEPILAGTYNGTTPSVDHNQYIVEDRAFQANYSSGLRILDLNDVVRPVEVGYFDTFPAHDSARAGGRSQFVGAWSNYPFFKSGIVVVSSIHEGLFVVQPTGPAKTAITTNELPDDFRLLPPYPNPFNPQTTIALEVEQPQHIRVTVYDAQGKELTTLFSGFISSAGRREFLFDASLLSSGVYLVRATGRSATQVISVTLQK